MVYKADMNRFTEQHRHRHVDWRLLCAAVAAALLPAGLFCALSLSNGVPAREGGVLCTVCGVLSLLICGGLLGRLLAFCPKGLSKRTARRLMLLAGCLGALCLAVGLLFVYVPGALSYTVAIIMFVICVAALLIAFFSSLNLARRIARERHSVSLSQFLTVSLYRLARIRARCSAEETRAQISSVMAALRAADPHSDFDTAECEDTVSRYIRQLSLLKSPDDIAAVEPICDALRLQIARREEICRSIRAAAERAK